MKLNIQATIKSISRTPDGNFHIDQEITSVRRDTIEELKELIIPKHWTIPIKRSRKEPLTKEEIDWRHRQAKEEYQPLNQCEDITSYIRNKMENKDKSPRKEKKKPKKKDK